MPTRPTNHPSKVIVSRDEIATFNTRWPGSPLSDARHYWFEFDANGDLVDTDVPEHSDGPAAVAMAADCEAWLFNGDLADWMAVRAEG